MNTLREGSMLTDEKIIDELKMIIQEATRRPFASLGADSSLEELNIDSLDRIKIIIEVEERFGIDINERAAGQITVIEDLIRRIRPGTTANRAPGVASLAQ